VSITLAIASLFHNKPSSEAAGRSTHLPIPESEAVAVMVVPNIPRDTKLPLQSREVTRPTLHLATTPADLKRSSNARGSTHIP